MSGKHLVWVLICAVITLAGCASSQKVDLAAIRAAASMSSEQDRQLALSTFARLPEGAIDYKIGPGDVLEIGVFQWELSEETKTLDARVSEEGTVSLPLVGDLGVKGKTVRDVKVMIEKALKAGEYIKAPRVSVVIKEFRSKRVSLVGAVKDPGTYTLRSNVTQLLDVLSLAGGLAETAGQHLYVVRSRSAGEDVGKVITIDLHDLLVAGRLELNVVLSDGDVVSVPLAQKFFVYGYVRNPGAYDLKRRTTVLESIAIAGGLDRPMASPTYCILRRGKDNSEMELDLVEIAEGAEPDHYLLPNDTVEVRQTFLRKVGLMFWEGVRSVFHVGYTLNN